MILYFSMGNKEQLETFMNKSLFSRMMIVETGEFEFITTLYSNEFVVDVFMYFAFLGIFFIWKQTSLV